MDPVIFILGLGIISAFLGLLVILFGIAISLARIGSLSQYLSTNHQSSFIKYPIESNIYLPSGTIFTYNGDNLYNEIVILNEYFQPELGRAGLSVQTVHGIQTLVFCVFDQQSMNMERVYFRPRKELEELFKNYADSSLREDLTEGSRLTITTDHIEAKIEFLDFIVDSKNPTGYAFLKLQAEFKRKSKR